MSVKVMGQVWDLDLPHNKLLVLLAMADHAPLSYCPMDLGARHCR